MHFFRRNRWRSSAKKSFLKNFANFTGKYRRWSLFLINLYNSLYIKKRLQQRCFPAKFAKFLRTPILRNICERLLLFAAKYWRALK